MIKEKILSLRGIRGDGRKRKTVIKPLFTQFTPSFWLQILNLNQKHIYNGSDSRIKQSQSLLILHGF